MLKARMVRKRAMAVTLVTAMAAATGAVAVALSGSTAAASTTGFYYAAGIFPTKTQNLSIGSLTKVSVQDDAVAVANTMTTAELQAATTALGGTPTQGFQVTKVFDRTDLSTSIAALAETTLYSAGLYTYYKGALCDHLRSAPAYVAFVNQSPPPAGSTAALTETIEIVGTALAPVIPDSCPTPASTVTSGTTYTGTLTSGGSSYSWPSISQVTFEADPKAITSVMSAQEQSNYTAKEGVLPSMLFSVTKRLDVSDKKLTWPSFEGGQLANSTLVVAIKSQQATLTYTLTAPFVVSIDNFVTQNGVRAETVTFAPTMVKVSYS